MFSVDEANRASYYAYLARLNYECADHADKKIGLLPGYAIAAPPPVMTLCAHAIELSLKSRLLKDGLAEKDVRGMGHDLVKLWNACKAHAGDLPEIDEEILTIISDLLTSHRLRYGEQPKLGKVPVYGPLSELVRQCLEIAEAPKLSYLVK